jgi:DUF1365 family protein
VRSCIYEGTVRHRRHGAAAGDLRFDLFMAYLDLDELPGVFDGSLLFSARRPAPAWFRRADHLGNPERPLAECVRELVGEQTGTRPRGPIGLLTNLRHLGNGFNPVSFYYCFAPGGERLCAAVAHVTNTPWGDSHSYVLACEAARRDRGSAAVFAGSFGKLLHVSPLMGMDHAYEWRLTAPGERLAVHIDSRGPGGDVVFDATLALRRREITPAGLRRVLLRHPAQTTRILGRIYSSALALRLRGARYHPRPAQPSPHASTVLPAAAPASATPAPASATPAPARPRTSSMPGEHPGRVPLTRMPA